MTLQLLRTGFASPAAQTVSLSQIVQVDDTGANPAYLIVSGLDRNDYTAGDPATTGSFAGNGHAERLTAIGGDSRGAGVVFSWNAATGSYVNAQYGNLLDLTYTSSASPDEVADISIFGTNSYHFALAFADDSATMAVNPTIFTNFGTATVATQSVGAATATLQATPQSVIAAAEQFVGDTWNINACWLLASTIDAEAGAALGVASTSSGTPGAASGEWQVAYNGPVSADANWQSLLQPGDQVVFRTTGNTDGHIATVVSGSGAAADVIDNAYFVNPDGSIANSANDGDANDITVAAAHPFSQELAGVDPASVVVYRLDTPVVTAAITSETLGTGASLSLSSIASGSDWANTQVTAFQVYQTASSDSLTVNGAALATAHSADTAATVSSLSDVQLQTGDQAADDSVVLRAFNGTSWGDWTTIGVTVQAPETAPALAAASTVSTGLGLLEQWLQSTSQQPPAGASWSRLEQHASQWLASLHHA